MKKQKMKFLSVKLSSVLAGLAIACVASNVTASEGRSVVEECMRCHDIPTYQHELKYSAHKVDADGKAISCEQCHELHINPVTNYYARDEYYDKKIFQPGDFDRRAMQNNARGAVSATKCLACHKDLSKNVKGEEISQIGALCHEAYEGKNGSTNRNCAGCHINIAHLPEFDRDLQIRADFAKRLADNPKPAAEKGGNN